MPAQSSHRRRSGLARHTYAYVKMLRMWGADASNLAILSAFIRPQFIRDVGHEYQWSRREGVHKPWRHWSLYTKDAPTSRLYG